MNAATIKSSKQSKGTVRAFKNLCGMFECRHNGTITPMAFQETYEEAQAWLDAMIGQGYVLSAISQVKPSI